MDQLAQLDRWKDFLELVDIVKFIVFERPGYPFENAPHIPNLCLHRLEGYFLDVSSTELRSELRKGKSDGLCLPEAASKYIQSHKLYKE